ncbi:hypothetical protein BIV57_07965 [Mangrovactinospora gilvigrisea]|uniref:Uncharacterized protein n=1 Tax=Mangrovactinospora gilvigrisea TaxID=1428644 RepID=A0A1J7CEA3_9ACTN|nr:hypothetical protein [Mangrovactinospora gilvigrisea]OIV38002.1 hypothetical protein BIV57_07965 [Mangrovactinospora gilvigrisea]
MTRIEVTWLGLIGWWILALPLWIMAMFVMVATNDPSHTPGVRSFYPVAVRPGCTAGVVWSATYLDHQHGPCPYRGGRPTVGR